MSAVSVAPIICCGVTYIEMPHEFRKVALRGADEQMKMVAHQWCPMHVEENTFSSIIWSGFMKL